MGARLFGGYVNLDPKDPMSDIITRLLSIEALGQRVGLLDNVKTLKFSWGQLESLITGQWVSGHRMYKGESKRPNTLTYAITLNGASLSKDMAQRVIPVKLAKPDYDAAWQEQTEAFIDANRWEIVGDIGAALQGPAAPLERVSRWGMWESAVLSRVGEPVECQRVIRERQGEADEDGGRGRPRSRCHRPASARSSSRPGARSRLHPVGDGRLVGDRRHERETVDPTSLRLPQPTVHPADTPNNAQAQERTGIHLDRPERHAGGVRKRPEARAA
jgi:hypothetical protein